LCNILGFAQLAKKCLNAEALSEEDIRQVDLDLGKIEEASLYTRDIIRKLLVFARQAPTKKNLVDLNRIIANGLNFFESRCAKSGIEIERGLAPDLPRIEADPAQINQVLVNLVVNALQAMPDGGRLLIRTNATDHQVELTVEDTGVGMNPDIIDQIFLPFFTTKDVGEGTGLGLPVVHGIVTSHGGTIRVQSKPGQGARFEVLLPIAATQPQDREAIV
jgi:signal transduction histidine kinase